MTGQTAASEQILCPVCLTELRWDELTPARFDGATQRYEPLHIPPEASERQARRLLKGARMRCPDPTGAAEEHYLPIEYGGYGKPVVLGLVGATSSGKTHLLAAMVGALESGGLGEFGLTCRPLDDVTHLRFMEENVRPLLSEQRVIHATGEKITHFADAFLIGSGGPGTGRERVVAIFDVAGVELGKDRTASYGPKPFLEVADGLIFVVDPGRFDLASIGEDTFNTVLGVLSGSGRLALTSAAVVLNKADLVRFDDPVTRWLLTGVAGADPDQVSMESADVFAYLQAKGIGPVTRPVLECGKATLHVATATGGSNLDEVYPRGVRPRRVLMPLIALLAMTGVITDHEAGQIGARR